MSAIVHAERSSPWRPSALIVGSFVVHLVALALLFVDHQTWPWTLGSLVANHLLLTAIGLWPRSRLLGPNVTRLPESAVARSEVALTFDDGPDPDLTPRVLEILEAHGARATFFCIAAKAARHPEITREIARRGHAVENHSHSHGHTFAFLLWRGLRRDLSAAQSALSALTGRTPRFFRPPMGFRNPLLDPMLHELGLTHVTWTRRGYDTNLSDPIYVAGLLERGLAAGDILLLHDGQSAIAPSGQPVVIEVLPRLLAAIQARGLKPVTLPQAIEP